MDKETNKPIYYVDGPARFGKYFLETYYTIFPPKERNTYANLTLCRNIANKRYKNYLKFMKKLYKIGGWICLLTGLGCLWGIGAVVIFSGLTLFWFGATIDDAKCY